MHTSFVVEIIFYAIALLLFVACYAIFIRKRFTNVQALLRKTNVGGNHRKSGHQLEKIAKIEKLKLKIDNINKECN